MRDLMKQLEVLLREMELSHDVTILKKYEAYMEGVSKWNKMVNLTTIPQGEKFIKKHFVDSLLCAKSKEFRGAQVIVDVGTGAGFPGVPLAIVHPEKQFVLMDALKKRLNIVSELCCQIEIKNVTTIHGRAEDFGKQKKHREQYDVCLARAVAELATLSEYCLPLVNVGGSFIAYKGKEIQIELEESKKAIETLGGRMNRTENTERDDFELQHNIIYIHKEKPTPSKYPRKAGTPTKAPLK